MSLRVPGELGLELVGFVPYRLNRLAVGVSQHLSDIYRERFGLDVPEWRVMATVGSWHGCTAQHIAESTRMHKTRVSRAVAHLEERELIERARAPPTGGRGKCASRRRAGACMRSSCRWSSSASGNCSRA